MGVGGVGAGAEIRTGEVTILIPVLGGSARRAVAEVAPQLLNPQIQRGRGTTAAGGRGLGGILEAGPVAPAPQEENKARYGF